MILILVWHTSPIWLWHWRLEPELRGYNNPGGLRPQRWEVAPTPRSRDWDEFVAGEIAMRVPVAAHARAHCGRCTERCRIDLEARGSLAVFQERPPGDYHDILHAYAPDARDLSLLRSVAANWKTIDAVADRVRVPRSGVAVSRFDAPHSRGVVSELKVGGRKRFVIYAFAKGSGAGQILAVAGLAREDLEAILGTLQIETLAERPGQCTPASLRAERSVPPL